MGGDIDAKRLTRRSRPRRSNSDSPESDNCDTPPLRRFKRPGGYPRKISREGPRKLKVVANKKKGKRRSKSSGVLESVAATKRQVAGRQRRRRASTPGRLRRCIMKCWRKTKDDNNRTNSEKTNHHKQEARIKPGDEVKLKYNH